MVSIFEKFCNAAVKFIFTLLLLIIIYLSIFFLTCYHPDDGAVSKLKYYFLLKNIKFEPGIHSKFYSQPNYYGDCGILAIAKVKMTDESNSKLIVYKLHRSWFFCEWNIIDVSDYNN